MTCHVLNCSNCLAVVPSWNCLACKRHKATPANPQCNAERCETPSGADSSDALAPAKTGHHSAGIRKCSAAPAWLWGHNVRV